MRRIPLAVLAVLAVFAATALTVACGPPVNRPTPLPMAKPNFYLRTTSFDADPSTYLGRFISDDLADARVDESNAQHTPCSRFFRVERLPGGGVEYDEYFTTASEARAGAVSPAAAAGAVAARAGATDKTASVARVQYTLTDKWVVELSDPEAYGRCCDESDNNCTERVIGEFLGGTGAVFEADMAATTAGLGAPGLVGVEFRDGIAWRRSVRFAQPVFFAFKLTLGRVVSAAATRDWCERPPRVAHGRYFCGVSDWKPSEQDARGGALRDARRQVIAYLGDQIVQSTEIRRSLAERAGRLESALSDTSQFEHISRGVARFVKDEEWRVDNEQGPHKMHHKARVLAFIGNDQIVDALAAAADALP